MIKFISWINQVNHKVLVIVKIWFHVLFTNLLKNSNLRPLVFWFITTLFWVSVIVQSDSVKKTTANVTHSSTRCKGVTTSRATSGEGRNDRNTSGQRGNKFNNSYRYISVVVAENSSVVEPKCDQYTSLNKISLKQFFRSVDGAYIFYCCSKQWRHRKRHRWHSERHQEELYLCFVTRKKQSCCKAKNLLGSTSLLKKLSSFPNALSGTIFLLLYEPTEVSGKASVTPGKVSGRMIITICNLL